MEDKLYSLLATFTWEERISDCIKESLYSTTATMEKTEAIGTLDSIKNTSKFKFKEYASPIDRIYISRV